MEGMDLKEFVQRTITQIVDVVGESRVEVQAKGDVQGGYVHKGMVNPMYLGGKIPKHAQSVHFDVAVTVTEQAEGGGNAGISVVGFELGGSGKTGMDNVSASRIQFTVPVLLPSTDMG